MEVASQEMLVVKNSPANAGDVRDMHFIPGLRRPPGEGHGNPFQYDLPGKSHGQRILAGPNPQGCKESDTSKVIHAHHTVENTVGCAR